MCFGGWDQCSYQLREIAFIDFALPWPNTRYEVARKFLRGGGVLSCDRPLSFAKNVRLRKFRFVLRFEGSAVAMHGHAFRRVRGHPGALLRAVFPAEGCGDGAASSGGQRGEGGSRLAAGMGAVTEELEGSVERSLVQGSDWRIEEAWGESHDHRAAGLLCGRAGDTNKSASFSHGLCPCPMTHFLTADTNSITSLCLHHPWWSACVLSCSSELSS